MKSLDKTETYTKSLKTSLIAINSIFDGSHEKLPEQCSSSECQDSDLW